MTKMIPRARPQKALSILLAVLASSLVVLMAPAVASAATYTVDSTGDQADQNPGTDGCKTAVNTCTLRAAIEEANDSTGIADEVVFAAAFNGQLADTITLGSGLPTIAGELEVDGVSAGVCMTAAGVNGPCAGVSGPAADSAFSVSGESVTIIGLSVTAAETAVEADEAFNAVVNANWLGTKLDGSAAVNEVGVAALAGGTIEIADNQIRGGDSPALDIIESEAEIDGNTIVGGQNGVRVEGEESIGTIISGNTIEDAVGAGVEIETDLVRITGNDILDSGDAGIRLEGAADESIIGSTSFEPVVPQADENTISGSDGDAIEINTLQAAKSNRVFRNNGSGNEGLFIDLIAPSPGTEPIGPNNGIDPPEIETAEKTEVSGTAEPETLVRVFRKASIATGEIASFLGSAEADGSGDWSLTYSTPIPGGTPIGATQTPEEEEEGTSELAIAVTDDPPLTVTKLGTGTGSVSSSPAGIICGGTCTFEFALDTDVTLTATADGGSTFAGWGGACTGTGTCIVTMDLAKTVTATFNANPPATCATNPALCPPVTPPVTNPPTPPVTKKPKPLKCKKGFVKKKVKGKQKCVKKKVKKGKGGKK